MIITIIHAALAATVVTARAAPAVEIKKSSGYVDQPIDCAKIADKNAREMLVTSGAMASQKHEQAAVILLEDVRNFYAIRSDEGYCLARAQMSAADMANDKSRGLDAAKAIYDSRRMTGRQEADDIAHKIASYYYQTGDRPNGDFWMRTDLSPTNGFYLQ